MPLDIDHVLDMVAETELYSEARRFTEQLNI